MPKGEEDIMLLSKLFTKKAEPDDSGSASVFMADMEETAAALEASFVRQYGWDADDPARKLDSLMLAKFLLDQALVSTFCDKLSRKRLRNLLTVLDMVYEKLLEKVSPGVEPDAAHLNKFRDYSVMLRENNWPRCWQLIAGACIGRDLVEEKPTKEIFPEFLPERFIVVRERLKEVIK